MIAFGWTGVFFFYLFRCVFLSSDETSLVPSHVYTYRVEDRQDLIGILVLYCIVGAGACAIHAYEPPKKE
jgi:hypothetical protein